MKNISLVYYDLDTTPGGTVNWNPAEITDSIEVITFRPPINGNQKNPSYRTTENSDTWHTLRNIPCVVGKMHNNRDFFLYSDRGCSSLLKANLKTAKEFHRDQNFHHEDTILLTTRPLNTLIDGFQLKPPDYMHMDIQGSELEVMNNGGKYINEQVLAVRTEVFFIPLYYDQPLFSDIDPVMREKGFNLFGFPKIRHWRYGTKENVGTFTSHEIPYSKGPVIHADALYFRNFDFFSERSPEVHLKAAMLGILYSQFDYAEKLLTKDMTWTFLEENKQIEVQDFLSKLSREEAKQELLPGWTDFKRSIGSLRQGWKALF